MAKDAERPRVLVDLLEESILAWNILPNASVHGRRDGPDSRLPVLDPSYVGPFVELFLGVYV